MVVWYGTGGREVGCCRGRCSGEGRGGIVVREVPLLVMMEGVAVWHGTGGREERCVGGRRGKVEGLIAVVMKG